MQQVETFPATCSDRGNSYGDAASVMAAWLQANPRFRVAALTGNEHYLIAVVEPAGLGICALRPATGAYKDPRNA